ncbi:MAG: PAS domain S-box protein [Calditrichaeota bacterium]|nr:PAS domain S-box protein [Calditrichota bacterium]
MEEAIEGTTSYRLMRDYQTTITILEHLSDAIFILNPKGDIQYANRVATDLLGQNLEDLLEKNLNEFLSARFMFPDMDDAEGEKSFLEKIYHSGFCELESTLKNNGYETPVIISFGIVRGKQDNVNYIIASAKDVSLRKNLEKELMQKQLFIQSRDRYRELGELAINIVHRLSQPITSVQLLIDMMQQQIRSENVSLDQFQKNFEQIKERLNLMSEVITNVRNFAFLTEEETLKLVDVNECIGNAIQQLQYELTEADVAIELNKENSLPSVLANPLNLQQVFTTLLRFFLDAFEKTAAQKSKQIQIRLHSFKDRWVEILLYNGESENIADKKAKLKENTKLVSRNFNLTITQLILTSIGGDFSYLVRDPDYHSFLLRIPAGQGDERQLLLNLIDLMK